MGNNDELDLASDFYNPLRRPDKRFLALAGAALPVLIDRAGGSVTFSDADYDAVKDRYGGHVAVHISRTADGRFTASLVPSKKERRPAHA
jgi:hypothetical protein